VTATQGSVLPGTPRLPMKVKDEGKRNVFGQGKKDASLGVKDGTRCNVKAVIKEPSKRVLGQKPFKMPRQSVLTDIYNEASY